MVLRRFLKSTLYVISGLSLASVINVADAGSFSAGSCSFNGIKLQGKVKVVESFPDVKVKVVDSFPDLKVQQVTSFPDECGKWQIVNSGEDFKIKFVDSFPDVKIRFVSSFPGT